MGSASRGPGSRRSLCAALDIKGWSGRLVPEQIRAQQALVSVAMTACREAGLPERIVQSSGDGVLILPPSDIDETTVIPALVAELEVALWQENRLLAQAARIRLRLALTSGLVIPGPAGFNGAAVIDCFRLLDSRPVKAALEDFPQAQLAVIVSDHLFQDVIRNGFRSLRAEDFWRVRSSLPAKGFSMDAWLYVSDRAGGPASGPAPGDAAGAAPDPAREHAPDPEPGTRPQGEPCGKVAEARAMLRQGRPEDAMRLLDEVAPDDPQGWTALLDTRAEALMRLGQFTRARLDLEELLGMTEDPVSPPGPAALLRLGRCHVALGALQEARQTWMFLLEHRPSSVEAHLELGRLERRAQRYGTAQNYLVEGLRLVRAEPPADRPAADRLLDEFLRELAALPVADDPPEGEPSEGEPPGDGPPGDELPGDGAGGAAAEDAGDDARHPSRQI
ncbi:tetratricopeptide repeat protein [Actinomadura formosensis]|uniref:tetratricopeptide repeat protein n=1 Tax=Actinomadura formosensis TaxID=60706 RepID=UPI000835AF9F|nr:tetratricopeptide repeat protein [Actinomadura formosensis]